MSRAAPRLSAMIGRIGRIGRIGLVGLVGLVGSSALIAACGPSLVERAAAEPHAVRLKSGMVLRTLRPGDGPSPGPHARVKVHYHGTLIDGSVFDSSVLRGEPAVFPLDGVIPCWTEGIQRMHVGEKAKLVCPSNVAYGDQGNPPTIPGSATLIFEVQLLAIE